MSRHLEGAELQAFADAFDRAMVEFREVLQLAQMQPRSEADWQRSFVMLAEAWHRHGAAIADMAKAATGEDISGFFAAPGQGRADQGN